MLHGTPRFVRLADPAEYADAEHHYRHECPVPGCGATVCALLTEYWHVDPSPSWVDEYGQTNWSDSSSRRETWVCPNGHVTLECWDNQGHDDCGPCGASTGTPIPKLALPGKGLRLTLPKGGRPDGQ